MLAAFTSNEWNQMSLIDITQSLPAPRGILALFCKWGCFVSVTFVASQSWMRNVVWSFLEARIYLFISKQWFQAVYASFWRWLWMLISADLQRSENSCMSFYVFLFLSFCFLDFGSKAISVSIHYIFIYCAEVGSPELWSLLDWWGSTVVCRK